MNETKLKVFPETLLPHPSVTEPYRCRDHNNFIQKEATRTLIRKHCTEGINLPRILNTVRVSVRPLLTEQRVREFKLL